MASDGASGTAYGAMPARISGLPSFFVIGPPRTGTSWLHEILRERAHLPRPAKETRFFDTYFHRGIEWCRAHYQDSSDGRPIGEIAPTYFASAKAREHIAQTIPQARVVCIFRNPVERVLSLYRLKRAYAMIPWTFEQAILRDPELTESSKYTSNLKAWQSALGRNQVLATIYDDLRDKPQSYLDSLADFIGIPKFTLSPSQIRHVHACETMTHPRNYHRTRSAMMMAEWCKSRRLDRVVAVVKSSPLIKLFLGGGPAFGELSREVSLRLYEHFRPEVEELEATLNRDLSAWKSSVCEATLP